MQFSIDVIREKIGSSIGILRASPSFPESIEPLAATFGAWSVACGKRHGFIQEEQLRVAIRRHHSTPPTFEF
jgi:hypothetical protein